MKNQKPIALVVYKRKLSGTYLDRLVKESHPVQSHKQADRLAIQIATQSVLQKDYRVEQINTIHSA